MSKNLWASDADPFSVRRLICPDACVHQYATNSCCLKAPNVWMLHSASASPFHLSQDPCYHRCNVHRTPTNVYSTPRSELTTVSRHHRSTILMDVLDVHQDEHGNLCGSSTLLEISDCVSFSVRRSTNFDGSAHQRATNLYCQNVPDTPTPTRVSSNTQKYDHDVCFHACNTQKHGHYLCFHAWNEKPDLFSRFRAEFRPASKDCDGKDFLDRLIHLRCVLLGHYFEAVASAKLESLLKVSFHQMRADHCRPVVQTRRL